MIFVTVGSVAPFDSLIKEIDNLLGEKLIKGKTIMQIGNGRYIPKNCEWFRFKDSIEKDIQKANLVISHAGAGITYECLEKNEKLIVVVNPSIRDKHQDQIAKKFSEEGSLIWCKNLKELEDCIKEAKKTEFEKYKKPKCEIHKKIGEFLG